MTAVRFWFRAEVRNRWRSLAWVSLLCGLAVTVTLTALAGSRRTATAVDRFLDDVDHADLAVDVSNPDDGLVAEAAGLPGVETLGGWEFLAVEPLGLGLRPGLTVVGVIPITAASMHDLDRLRIRAGRLPRSLGETAVDPGLAHQFGIGIGDRIDVAAVRPAQADALFVGTEPVIPTGPVQAVQVVGLVEPAEFVIEGESGVHLLVLSPGYSAHYQRGYTSGEGGDEVLVFRRVLRVLLEPGADESQVLAAIDAVYGGGTSTVPGGQRTALQQAVEDSLRVEVVGLWLFAAAAAMAGFVAVGHAVARSIALAASQDDVINALGLTRFERSLGLTGLGSLVGLVGGTAGTVGAVVASRLMPIGSARRVEPHPGMAADWLVLGLGLAVTVTLVSGRAAVSAWRATGGGARWRRPSRVAARLSRAGVGAAGRLGVRWALDGGQGRTSIPVRPVLAGAAVGVAGIVGAFVFAASLDHLGATPGLFGRDWDVEIVLPPTDSSSSSAAETHALTSNPDLEDVAHYSLTDVQAGSARVTALVVEVHKGVFAPSLLSGRRPERADEVVADRHTLARMGRSVGDTVDLETDAGVRQVRIVGRTAGDDGLYIDPRLTDPSDIDVFEHGYHVSFAEGVDGQRVFEALARAYPDIYGPSDRAGAASDIGRARAFPRALGAFLAVLAVSAVGHGAAVSTRRRRRDLAVLKAVGYTPGQTGLVIAWYATTVVVLGLAGGVPLGLASGALAWAEAARRADSAVAVVVPLAAVLAIACGAALIAHLVVYGPARRAARLEPAAALRVE